jgi:hypothetical protein
MDQGTEEDPTMETMAHITETEEVTMVAQESALGITITMAWVSEEEDCIMEELLEVSADTMVEDLILEVECVMEAVEDAADF